MKSKQHVCGDGCAGMDHSGDRRDLELSCPACSKIFATVTAARAERLDWNADRYQAWACPCGLDSWLDGDGVNSAPADGSAGPVRRSLALSGAELTADDPTAIQAETYRERKAAQAAEFAALASRVDWESRRDAFLRTLLPQELLDEEPPQ